MDFNLHFNFTSAVLFSTFVLFLIKAWRSSRLQKDCENLPPSPPKLPIIGHLHLLLGGVPHYVIDRVTRKYGRILHLRLGEISAVVISTREGAKQVLKDQDPACADRAECLGYKVMWYNYADLAFSPYNEHWRQMRKICVSELLSAKNVKVYGYIMQDEASNLIESIRSSCGESTNLTEKLLKMGSSVICRAAIGKDMKEEHVELIKMMRKGLTMAGGFELADLFPSSKLMNLLCLNKYRLLWMRRKLNPIFDGILDQHKRNQGGEFGGEDIVDVLLRIMNNKELNISLTSDNIKGIIFDMFAGGTETTAMTIDWAMAELMRNPRVMTKLQAEIREVLKGKKTIEDEDIQGMKYLKLVIKETLRLHPAATILPRACRDKCTVDGYSIPLKSKVVVNVWSLGRDPEYWDEPEAFRPERFEDSSIDFTGSNFEYLPFGSGKRMCPGMHFALANIEVPLARLLYHFDWRMPGKMVPYDIDMRETGGLSVSRQSDLYLVPIVHNAA